MVKKISSKIYLWVRATTKILKTNFRKKSLRTSPQIFRPWSPIYSIGGLRFWCDWQFFPRWGYPVSLQLQQSIGKENRKWNSVQLRHERKLSLDGKFGSFGQKTAASLVQDAYKMHLVKRKRKIVTNNNYIIIFSSSFFLLSPPHCPKTLSPNTVCFPGHQ